MIESILTSVKQTVGIEEAYTAFDHELTVHINSVFNTLHQLKVGPAFGFWIEDEKAKWEDFLEDDVLINQVRSYMTLRVRLLWDPPTNSFLVNSMKEQIKEMEWRLNVTTDTEGDPLHA